MTQPSGYTPAAARSLRTRQGLTLALLFGGYAAYYFCRADLSAAMPLLVSELAERGLPRAEAVVHLGTAYSAGVLAYALGKLALGGLGDYWGGRRSFLLGLGGATVFTLAFAAGGGLPVFTLAWIGNRLTQSVGWAGLLKVSSRWFDYTTHGTVIGFLSLSYLVGDALARPAMGLLIANGAGWRTLFCFAAAVAGAFFVANLILLRESRTELGHPEAEPSPRSLYGAGAGHSGGGLIAFFRPLLTSPAFGLVCLLSFGCTIVRETFNIWTPVYLKDSAGFSAASAASLSAVFPAVGAVSLVATGWLGDRLGSRARPLLLLGGLAACAATLATLALPADTFAPALVVALIGLVAFCLLGPYSYLGGVFALEFGGRRGGAASSGIIDGVGYLGGVLAGDGVARIAVALGWRGVFLSLAGVCAASALAAADLYRRQRVG